MLVATIGFLTFARSGHAAGLATEVGDQKQGVFGPEKFPGGSKTETKPPVWPVSPDFTPGMRVTSGTAAPARPAAAPVAIQAAPKGVSEADRKFVVRGQRSSWSPDGKKIVFGQSGSDDGILIYDVATKTATSFATTGKDPVWSGKDGRWIAYVAGSGATEAIWAAELPDGKPFRVSGGCLPSCAADGKTLFFQAYDKNQLMSLEVAGNAQFSPPRVRSAVPYRYPSVSPDGKRVAYKSGSDLVIQQVEDGKIAKRYVLPQGTGLLGGWSPDSRQFGFGGWNADDRMPCIILDVETGLARQVAAHGLTMPAWSPDGTKITFDLRFRTETEIWMIDAEVVKKLPTFKMAVPAAERPEISRANGTTPAANPFDTAPVPVVPPAKPELLHAIEWQDLEQGFPAHIYQTGVSADGKLFFGAGDAGPSGAIRIFQVASGKQIQELLPGDDVWFSFAAFVPGGKYLAAGYNKDKDLYLWDLATGKVVRKFVGHTSPDNHLAVSPDGKRILSWSYGDDRALRLWDVETGKELKKLEGHAEKAEGVFSPDGKKVLTYSADKTLRLWDAESGQELKRLEGHDAAPTGCFSPDGKQVLSSSPDQTVRLWDVETGKEIRRFEGPKDKVLGACFVAGGKQVAARCDDRKFRVWETASGKLLREIDLADVGGDHGTMTASPDGRLGLVGHEDESVRVYDLASGKEIQRYDGARKARGFSFTPDGKFAVAGSFRAGLFVFRLPGGNPAKP
jgi:WD40 repeat protein